MKKLNPILMTVLVSGLVSGSISLLINKKGQASEDIVVREGVPVAQVRNEGTSRTNDGDFTEAIESAQPSVVHITASSKMPSDNPGGLIKKTGSGVLISEDGYIITNEHLTSDTYGIQVTLPDKRSFAATLVGSDINSDLAVLKIEGKNFPFLLYGNSDNIVKGQWVIALGYPLKLGETATAGIIGATHQVIGINKGEHPVEDFIETDAAINTGSSGGALINTSGELIGINSAFMSPTGSFIGYSYAIPINLAKKVVSDLITSGKAN